MPSSQAPARTRVFVSYSRRDSEAVDALVPVLQAQGYDVVVDRKDIAAAEVWRRRLEDLILDSDAVVFVISPHSITSEVCGWEVERTVAYGKKLVPILWEAVDARACPPEISDRNWVAWARGSSGLAPGAPTIEALGVAIERDISWERERTVWIGRAIRWDRALRPAGRLLRREEVMAVETWAAARPTQAAALPEVLLAYLAQSREQERKERDHLRSITGRAFVTPIANAIREREPDRALRLLATAAVLAEDADFSVVPQLWREGARCLMQLPLFAVGDRGGAILPNGETNRDAVFGVSRDCRFGVCQEASGAVRFFDLTTGADRWATTLTHRVRQFAVVDETCVVAVCREGEIVRYNSTSGAVEAQAAFSRKVDTIRAVIDERIVLAATGNNVMRYALDTNIVERVRAFAGEVVDIAYCAARGQGLALIVPVEGSWVAETFGLDEGEQYKLDDDVSFAAYSKDGTRVCLAERNYAEVFVTDSDAKPARIQPEPKENSLGDDFLVVALSDDGSLLLTASKDGTARLWDTTTGAEVRRFDHVDEALIVEAAFGPAMKTVLTVGSDCTVRLWCAETGEELMRVANRLDPPTTGYDHLGFDTAGLSDDGTRLWTVLPGGLLQVWAVRRFDELPFSRRATKSEKFARAFPLGDGRVVIRHQGRTLRIFDAAGEQQIAERDFGESVLRVRVFEEGDLAVGLTHTNSIAVRLSTDDVLWNVKHAERPETAVYAANAGAVAIGGGNYGSSGFVDLISLSGQRLAQAEMPGWVSAMTWHPERGLVLMGDVQGHFFAWSDDDERRPIWFPPFESKIEAFGLPPKGKHYYVVADLTLWRVGADDTREKILRLTSSTRTLTCDPSERIMFVDGLRGPQFIDLERGALLFEIEDKAPIQDDRSFRSAAITADWRRLLVATGGGKLLSYDVDGILKLANAPHACIAAALGHGNEIARYSERVDLLMSDRPADLAARLTQLKG